MKYLIANAHNDYGTFVRVYVNPAPGGHVTYTLEKMIDSDYRTVSWHVAGVYDTLDEVVQKVYFLEDDEIQEMKEKADRIIAKCRGK